MKKNPLFGVPRVLSANHLQSLCPKKNHPVVFTASSWEQVLQFRPEICCVSIGWEKSV